VKVTMNPKHKSQVVQGGESLHLLPKRVGSYTYTHK
jgi:hypothetical protein